MSAPTRQTPRAWQGAALMLLLAVAAAGIFLLDDIVAALTPSYRITVVLRDAPGLVAGSRVWVNGRDVGAVRTLALQPVAEDTMARVAAQLQLDASARGQVRRDSRVRLTTDRLIGEPVVDIAGGTAAAPPLAPGDTLRESRRLDGRALMERARAFQGAADTLLADMHRLRAPAELRLTALTRLQQELTRAGASFTATGDRLRYNAAAAGFEHGVTEALLRTRSTLQQLREADLGARLESGARTGLAAQAGALLSDMGRLRQTLATLDSTLRLGGGTVDRLVRDSALVRALAAARTELDSLIADAQRRPLHYIF